MPTRLTIRRRRATPLGCRSAILQCTRNIPVLQSVAGTEVGEISLTSPPAPGVTRKWTRLQDYSDEVALARIYAGFHYRFSAEVGKEMGKKIGEQAVTTQLRR